MSDKQVTLRKKIQHLFIPQFEGSRESFQELIPIFFMITVVMSGLYIMNMMISTVEYSPLRLIVFTLLFLVHMLLYWMILNFAQTERRTVLYLASQGMLIFVIVLVGGNFFLALGLFASISGTAVGTLGNKRLAIIGIFFYIILAIVNVLLLSNFEILRGLLPTFLGAVLFAAFFAYLFSRQVEARERAQNLLTDLEDAHKQLSEYALEVESLTLTNERQRMARELHDTLAQGLAGLILQLEAADSHLENARSGKAQDIIQQAMQRARTTLADARRAIDDLRDTQSAPQDLVEAIRDEAQHFTHTTGIVCQLQFCDPDEQLSSQVAETAIRAVSEGLMNIARHAQATETSVKMICNPNILQIEISDNGIGFDAQKAVGQSGHYGLLGMRERARILGGSLTIESQPARGTSLVLQLPLNDD